MEMVKSLENIVNGKGGGSRKMGERAAHIENQCCGAMHKAPKRIKAHDQGDTSWNMSQGMDSGKA